MIDWVEYAIARHGAQLRALAAERTLTDRERRQLDVCEEVITRFEARETQPGAPRKRKTYSPRRQTFGAPLVKSYYRD